MFIVLEGPSGVGKSTTASVLAGTLRAQGKDVLLTREPTDSPFGQAVRALEPGTSGRALALAVAADRVQHAEGTITGALSAGQNVVCDRYVASSLVLQRIDGLDIEELWEYNRHVLVPDVTIYLEADAKLLARRLGARNNTSRLEALGGPGAELAHYRDASAFLAGQGWRGEWVKVDDRPIESVVESISELLERGNSR